MSVPDLLDLALDIDWGTWCGDVVCVFASLSYHTAAFVCKSTVVLSCRSFPRWLRIACGFDPQSPLGAGC